MCRELEAGIHISNSGHCKCLSVAGTEITAEKQKDRAPEDSAVMSIILNFILRAFKCFEARDRHDQI